MCSINDNFSPFESYRALRKVLQLFFFFRWEIFSPAPSEPVRNEGKCLFVKGSL